jgi:uncharacterized damage-inducible protein DinB
MEGLADLLRTHVDYTAWASARLVRAASELTSSELMHDFKTADKSVLGTLVHVFAADRIWLARIEGRSPRAFVSEADRKLSVLQNDWPALHERWKKWAAGITAEDAQANIAYTDMKGNGWNQPLWELVLHVVNHGTHHRGQVSGFLRALGRVPPVLDLVVYQRESRAAKQVEN